MIIWLDAAGPIRPPKVFGLSLIERHLHALRLLRPTPSRIIVDLGPDQTPPPLPDRRLHRLPIEWRNGTGAFVDRCTEILQQFRGEPLLILDGATLVDARLHATLASLKESVAAFARESGDRAAALLLAPMPLDPALIAGATDASDFAEALQAAGVVRPLRDEEFKGFVRRLRRTLPHYLFRIETEERAAKIERFLFWSNYKGSTDIFTRYVYPPLVWILVGPLARARVHPNWVTLVSILLALGAIPLWAAGHFMIGFIMAYAMSVLDSVDGKLARLTFTDSVLGNYMDHGLDMVHPPVWYASWAYGLGIGVEGWHSPLGESAIAIVVLYVIDRLVLKIYPQIFKRAFHTHSRMDGIVRSFIARRNISLPLFTIGWLIGLGRPAFYLITAWQAATTLYHAVRTFWILVVEKAQSKERAPVEVARKAVKID